MAHKENYDYIGNELAVFKLATNWSIYIFEQLNPYLRGTVIEVGAGLGSRTIEFSKQSLNWIAVEPDEGMAFELSQKLDSKIEIKNIEVISGTLSDVPTDIKADTILYLDVLEHIYNDKAELELAYERLNPGGFLIVLAPAHQWLYSRFDSAIGHYRRYCLTSLLKIAPKKLTLLISKNIDSIGAIASLLNRLLLKQSMPTERQIIFWDRILVRLSTIVDPFICYKFGKTVLVVWEKSNSD